MEKRLVLFFVLVAVTMILFQQFVQPPRPRVRYSPEAPMDSTFVPDIAPTRQSPASPSAAPETGLFAGGEPVPAETATVATEFLELDVSSVGATIVACRLPGFPEDGDGVVSLFPENYAGALSMTVNRGGDHGLETLPFRMQILGSPEPDMAARVIWTATRPEGGWLRKTLDVPKAGYRCRLRVESRGLGLAGFRLKVPPGLRSTERNERDDRSYFAVMSGIAGQNWKQQPGKLKGASASIEGPMSWAGLRTKYFIAALVPDSLAWHRVATVAGDQAENIGFAVEGMAPGGGLDLRYSLYLGPLAYHELAPLGGGIVNAIEMGNRYLRPIGRVVLLFLTSVHTVVPNYGLVIILFAVVMKIVLHPLTLTSTRSMQKMQELQPKMAAIKEKYKNNPQKQQQETMKLYKEHGVNPLGGCLPMLLQMPIFFAMYPVLRSSIHLRGAAFIPGLVRDLSQPNPILPILMGITQFISGKMMATDKQNKALAYMMPIFMTYIFFSLPSGLVLYWLTFNMLQIGQQMWQKRRAATQVVA